MLGKIPAYENKKKLGGKSFEGAEVNSNAKLSRVRGRLLQFSAI